MLLEYSTSSTKPLLLLFQLTSLIHKLTTMKFVYLFSFFLSERVDFAYVVLSMVETGDSLLVRSLESYYTASEKA